MKISGTNMCIPESDHSISHCLPQEAHLASEARSKYGKEKAILPNPIDVQLIEKEYRTNDNQNQFSSTDFNKLLAQSVAQNAIAKGIINYDKNLKEPIAIYTKIARDRQVF